MSQQAQMSSFEFKTKIYKLATLFGWCLFALLVSFPIVFFIALFTFFDIIFLWMIGFWAVVLGFVIWYRIAMKNRFETWLDQSAFFPMMNLFYFAYSGGISAGLLFWGIIASLQGTLNVLIDMIIYVVFLSIILVIIHHIISYRKKKMAFVRVRYVKKDLEEVEQLIKKALEALKLNYQQVTKGSEWTEKIPTFELEELETKISYRQEYNYTIISINPDNNKFISKLRELEGKIDSYTIM